MPRRVPWPLRARLLLGGFAAQFLCIFTGMSLCFTIMMGGVTDFVPALGVLGGMAPARARVTAVSRTGVSVGDDDHSRAVWRVVCEYPVGTRMVRGRYHTADRVPMVGSRVVVEYVRAWPSVSRIAGLRPPHPTWVLAVLLLFPLVGGVVLRHTLREQFRREALVREGQLAVATLTHVERSGVSDDDGNPSYRFVFAYPGGAASYTTHTPKEAWKPYLPASRRLTEEELTTVAKVPLVGTWLRTTAEAKQADEPEAPLPPCGPDALTETVLYDPRDPDRTLVLSAELPDLRIDDQTATGGHPATGLAALIIPTGMLLAAGWALAQVLRW